MLGLANGDPPNRGRNCDVRTPPKLRGRLSPRGPRLNRRLRGDTTLENKLVMRSVLRPDAHRRELTLGPADLNPGALPSCFSPKHLRISRLARQVGFISWVPG